MLDRVLAGLAVVPFVMGAAAAPTASDDVAFSFTDPDITESSGLVVQGDLAFTINDSGDSGRVFAVDTTSGDTVGVTHWEDDPTDVEAIAPAGPGAVWVGDIGDNTETRDAVQVARVPVGRGDRTVTPTVYDLVYPDGAHNAETLLRDPTTGRLYVATKEVLGGTLYAAPRHLAADAPNRLRPVGPVLPIATDGSFLPDGKHLVVRNYSAATVYAFPSLEPLGTFALPAQPQGEGLAVHDGDRLLLSSEGVRSDVVSAELPADLARAVAPASDSASPAPTTPSPSDTAPPTFSREDTELPETTETTRPAWPWFLSGLLGVGVIILLTRSLRRR
jgi:hypothetical protein